MDDKSSQLRKDPHHGGWILLANQSEREQLLMIPRNEWPKFALDMLCDPESVGANVVSRMNTTLPDGSSVLVRVIANRFALYRVEGMEDREGVGLYDLMRGIGAHEIIIESEKREDTLITLHPHHYALTLQVIQNRINDLRRDVRMRAFSIFREWECGSPKEILHPHSQLIASSIIPLGLKNELDAAHEYFDYKERCLFCDILRQEINDGHRLIVDFEDYVTFCPFASRHPFEVHLFPKKHAFDYCEESRSRLPTLAAAIRDTAARLEQAVPGWQILMVLHTTPTFDFRREYYHTIAQDYHWHFEFLPKPPGWIDWNTRTGTPVTYTPPEKAAAFLRKLHVESPNS